MVKPTRFTRRRYSQAIKAVLLTFFFVCGLVLFNTLKPVPQSKLDPLAQDPAVKVYFNHNLTSRYKDPYRHFIRKGDNLENQIIDAINQAQSTVDVAVMEFRLPQVAAALIAKQKAGVKVRLLIDNKYNKTLGDYTPEEIARMNQHDLRAYEELKRYPTDAMALLRESGIQIKDDTSGGATKGSGLMHHKFVVVDGKMIIISSANFTTSDLHGDFKTSESRGNPNNMVVVPHNVQLAKAFTEEFNYMWQGLFKIHKPNRPPVTVPVGAGTITLKFSPARRKQDIATTNNGMIAYFVKQASSSVHVAVFVYSDQQISDTLSRVNSQGVKDIKVLIDPDFYRQPYSKAYDALGVCPPTGKRKSKIQVKPWQHPITTVGFPTSLIGDRGIHSKMAILDGRLVITGSQNWSISGNYLNDETLIVIQNPTVAAHYEREFSRLYQTAVLGLESLPRARKCQSVKTSTAPTSLKSVEEAMEQ